MKLAAKEHLTISKDPTILTVSKENPKDFKEISEALKTVTGSPLKTN
jgi:hypothetical protein